MERVLKLRSRLSLGLFLLVLGRCAFHPDLLEEQPITSKSRALRRFQRQIADTIRTYHLESAFLGIHIEEMQSQQVIYSLNGRKLFMPASNMKIITSAAALSLLKPEFRFTTGLYTNGVIHNDTLFGDVLVKGEGDPTIKSIGTKDTSNNFFSVAIAAFKALNIKHITGALKADVHAVESQWGESWCWDDLWYSYSAKPSALNLNNNCFTLYILPNDSVGKPAYIKTEPYLNYQIDNRLITADSTVRERFDFVRLPGSNVISVWGQIPQKKDTLYITCTVEEPALYFLQYFQHVLADSGITVCEYKMDSAGVSDYSQYQTIIEYQSPPLGEIVVTLNKVSHNLFAEQLLRTIGRVVYREGTARSGIKVIRNWLGQIGVDTNLVIIVDGSGLARTNLLTPVGIVQVLRTMRNGPYWDEFRNSLPVGGVDGTLQNRLRNSNAVGHVAAKTGYIGRVRALSGYVFSSNGKEYLFSILVNHYPMPTSVINALQDSIVTLLYNFKG